MAEGTMTTTMMPLMVSPFLPLVTLSLILCLPVAFLLLSTLSSLSILSPEKDTSPASPRSLHHPISSATPVLPVSSATLILPVSSATPVCGSVFHVFLFHKREMSGDARVNTHEEKEVRLNLSLPPSSVHSLLALPLTHLVQIDLNQNPCFSL